ncbi:MAG: L,D-transpeptidase family protein [Planctomycetota bacterium]|nr:L,D-transpeptidase family protein [Planctomycetota bacterium]
MARISLLAGAALCVAGPAQATNFPLPRDQKANSTQDERMEAARLQTALAKAAFSPGLIDGKPGRKTALALELFQRAHGIAPSGKLDEPTTQALGLSSETPWTRTYRITSADVDLITGPIPEDWNERATLEVCGYATLHELLAERGWCSMELVQLLNPGINLEELASGSTVQLPDVPDVFKPQSKGISGIVRLEVDQTSKMVRAFDKGGMVIALFHCSIAAAEEHRPSGDLTVQVVVTDPDYTFDPAVWPEVTNVSSKLRIAPGPRNPVGLAWIGLSKPGYGLHGTVRPQDIGKTGSHGCFRLANWDALRLVRSVRTGMPVHVLD